MKSKQPNRFKKGFTQHYKNGAGFTLIELLIVITIIATLAVAVFAALNPAKRLIDARDARRTSDVDTILTAIHQYVVDNASSYPAGMPAAGQERQIGTGNSTACTAALTGGGCNTPAATACADIGAGLTAYLKSAPVDPLGSPTYTDVKTGYSVIRDANGIVTIRACATEGATPISASR